jgi:hypothetical protein
MDLERSQANLHIDVHEVTVATFAPRRAVRSGSNPHRSWIAVDPPRPKQGPFPPDGVAFRVYRLEGGPFVEPTLPETRFPLRLSGFEPDRYEYAKRHPRPVVEGVSAAGGRYTVYAWIGPRASPERRLALKAVVASLTFPHLETGTVAGLFSVLSPSRAYEIGSFTRVRAQKRVFYLVHAPGGFYAIGWDTDTLPRNGRSRCAMRFDDTHKQFFCAKMGFRWDRIGRPVAYPAYSEPDPLNIATAGTSWDGHILLDPSIAAFGTKRIAKQFWPHWAPRTSNGK